MKLLLAFLSFCWICGQIVAQNATSISKKSTALYRQALQLSQEGNSLKSVQLLKDILSIDSTFYMAWFALADLSHEAAKPEDEIGYLRKGLSLAGDSYPAGYKFLAEVSFKLGKYPEALSGMNHFAFLKQPLNAEESLLRASCQFAVDAVAHPMSFLPVNAGDSINTHADEYWPSLNAEANELVFTRLQTTGEQGEKLKNPQEDFYIAHLTDSHWNRATALGPPVNSNENEGAQTISADGRWLVFTGCGRADGFGSCDLYLSAFKNGQWSEPINLGEGVNSGSWESQPSISADGQWLYFVSNRKGGKGKMDLWRAQNGGISQQGIPQFGMAVNLSELNTPENDFSPSLHADGTTLYFASEGWPGMGGSDLYVAHLTGNHFSEPVNLGYPLNTSRNETGLFVEVSGEKAWFSSDQNSDHGRDIFWFELPEKLKPKPVSYLKGTIIDAKTGARVSSQLVLTDLLSGKTIQQILPQENEGSFLVCLPAGVDYGLSFSARGYLFASEHIPLLAGFSKDHPRELEVKLTPIEVGASTHLKNIFFATDSWQLKEESRTQLDEMKQFLTLHPNLVMEVIGHTDHVGTERYNLELSEKRAKAVAEALKAMKIAPYQIRFKGVGYAFPIGDNETEEGRGLNRRTEFVVKEILPE